MASIDYGELYRLQDKVLGIVFDTESIFYLTGGTCLSRFYHEKRYSDDLDFFTHENAQFNRGIREIKVALSEKFTLVEEVTSKDFIRLRIEDLLQIDFVNDRVMRYESLNYLDNGYIIDNCKNIFANKITAIMGRDNPKDIFDIYLLDKFTHFDFKEIISVAHDKSGFSNDDLIIRLKTFPLSLLKSIVLKDESFLDDFDTKYKLLIKNIEEAIAKK